MSRARESELPRVSVVVPVRNGAPTIRTCVESLLAQRHAADRFEVVVVDNGSTDGTAQRVADYPVLRLRCPVPGASAARNVGVRHSTAEIVAFTDADCIADPGWLRELAAAFEDTSVGAAGGPIESFAHSGRSLIELFAEQAVWCANRRRCSAYRWRQLLRRGVGARAAGSLEAHLDSAVARWFAPPLRRSSPLPR